MRSLRVVTRLPWRACTVRVYLPDGSLRLIVQGLARVEIDYRAEVRWPAQLDIGVGLVALGRSSMTLIQGIFQGERCVATGREVMVLLDTATRHSTPWPDRLREVLTEQALVAG